jgi:hypothetical protein
MLYVRWIFAGLFLLVAVSCISFNWRLILARLLAKSENRSWVPFVGGVCGTASFLCCPLPAVNKFWWLPLLIDHSIIIGIPFLIYILLKERFN